MWCVGASGDARAPFGLNDVTHIRQPGPQPLHGWPLGRDNRGYCVWQAAIEHCPPESAASLGDAARKRGLLGTAFLLNQRAVSPSSFLLVADMPATTGRTEEQRPGISARSSEVLRARIARLLRFLKVISTGLITTVGRVSNVLAEPLGRDGVMKV